MKQPFKNKIVIITGASSGIGRSCAELLAKEGAKIVLVSRNLSKLQSVEKTLEGSGHLSIQTDVSDEKQVNSMVNQVMGKFKQIDILINNAGIGINGSVVSTPIDSFKKIIDINLLGVVYCIRAVFPPMKKQGGGHIINVSSVAGFKGFSDSGMYSATKFAVNGLTESFSWEAIENNIHVTLICPGKTYTNFEENLLYCDKKSNESRSGVTAEQVAKAIITGIKKKKRIVIVGKSCLPLYLLNRLSPALTDFILRFIY